MGYAAAPRSFPTQFCVTKLRWWNCLGIYGSPTQFSVAKLPSQKLAWCKSQSPAVPPHSFASQSCDTAHENTKTSNRVLKRKTTEEIVDKSLYDNFRTFTASEIDGVVVDGMTLRQRLQADKAKQKLDPYVADKAACNARSCYVGDSDADENLARVAGVRYHHVRDYFGAMFPRP